MIGTGDRVPTKNRTRARTSCHGDSELMGMIKQLKEFYATDGNLKAADLYEEVWRIRKMSKPFETKNLGMYVVISAIFPEGSLDSKGISRNKAHLKYALMKWEL